MVCGSVSVYLLVAFSEVNLFLNNTVGHNKLGQITKPLFVCLGMSLHKSFFSIWMFEHNKLHHLSMYLCFPLSIFVSLSPPKKLFPWEELYTRQFVTVSIFVFMSVSVEEKLRFLRMAVRSKLDHFKKCLFLCLCLPLWKRFYLLELFCRLR